LKPEQVDQLRAVAATLLHQSEEYRRLLKDLGAELPKEDSADSRASAK
jgi:hypothetical protein